MKSLFLAPLFLTAAAIPAHSAVVFSGIQNIAIPFDDEGVYLNVSTNLASASEPANVATSPTINFFYGGFAIGTDDFLRPVAANDGRVLNLLAGTTVSASSTFAGSPNGSATHVGVGADYFQFGQAGYIGFSFKITGSEASPYYGWLHFTPATDGSATIDGWAYDNVAGQSIIVGAIPEPATALLFSGLGLACLVRRRRC